MPLRLRIDVFALLLLLASCAPDLPSQPYRHRIDPALPPAVKECLSRDAVESYASALHEEIIHRWRVPRGSEADQRVTVRLRIAETGELLLAELASEQRDAFSDSVLRAVQESAPFPPMDPDVRCLANEVLCATFSNPLR